jgi:hypothetical protein
MSKKRCIQSAWSSSTVAYYYHLKTYFHSMNGNYRYTFGIDLCNKFYVITYNLAYYYYL